MLCMPWLAAVLGWIPGPPGSSEEEEEESKGSEEGPPALVLPVAQLRLQAVRPRLQALRLQAAQRRRQQQSRLMQLPLPQQQLEKRTDGVCGAGVFG